MAAACAGATITVAIAVIAKRAGHISDRPFFISIWL